MAYDKKKKRLPVPKKEERPEHKLNNEDDLDVFGIDTVVKAGHRPKSSVEDDDLGINDALLGKEQSVIDAEETKELYQKKTVGSWEIDLAGGVAFMKGHKNTPISITSHPTNVRRGLYSGGKDCCVISWDAEMNKKKVTFTGRRKDMAQSGHIGNVTGVGGIWDRGLVVSCGEGGKILVWDERVGTEPIQELVKARDTFTCLTVIPPSFDELKEIDDRVPRIMVGTDKGALQAWMVLTGEAAEKTEERKRIWNHYYGHTGRVNQIAMTCNNHERLVSGSDDKTTRYFNLSKDSHLLYDRHTSPVESVAQLIPALVASGDTDGNLNIWGTGNRRPVGSIENLFQTSKYENRPICALHCPQGGSQTVFAGGSAGEVRVLQVGDLISRRSEVKMHQKLTLNSNLHLDGSIKVEDRDIDVGLGTLNAFSTSVNVESGEGHLVAAMGREQRMGRWNVEKGAKDGIAIMKLRGLRKEI